MSCSDSKLVMIYCVHTIIILLPKAIAHISVAKIKLPIFLSGMCMYVHDYTHVRMQCLLTTLHIHVGIYIVTGPIYSSEMSPSHLRGKLGVINILFSTTGGMVGIIVAGLFSISYSFAYSFGWR